MLKEQLDKLKLEKVQKDKLDDEKKKAKLIKDEQKKKRVHDKLLDDMQKLKVEFTGKRDAKQLEEAEKKALLAPEMDAATKAIENKANMRARKQLVIE